ncbi:hypothetical protein ACP70R_044795 [Stipagrostis hirtigluma subsp. patula]
MSRKTKATAPPPAVASTGCSSLMCCHSLHRRAPPPPRDKDAAAAAEKYWKRVQFLEEEIRRLSKWLAQEERPAPAPVAECAGNSATAKEEGGGGAATECVRSGATAKAMEDNGGSAAAECVRSGATAKAMEDTGGVAADCVRSSAKPVDEAGNVAKAKATVTTTGTKRCDSVGHGGGGGVEQTARLEDGSYLHEVRLPIGRPWERLAVQVSRPVVPQDAASAAEVLDKMTAMRADDLCKFLTQMMPLKDVTGRQNPGEPALRTTRPGSGDDLMEALLLKSMDKMEALVLEGLKIQMASTATATPTATAGQQRQVSKDRMVIVSLMQVRDPMESYGAIGDPMVGLIEASLERKDGKVKLATQGLHVAGISFVNRRKSSDDRCVMWSASLRKCEESRHGAGDGCRCTCVRNPNRVFRR